MPQTAPMGRPQTASYRAVPRRARIVGRRRDRRNRRAAARALWRSARHGAAWRPRACRRSPRAHAASTPRYLRRCPSLRRDRRNRRRCRSAPKRRSRCRKPRRPNRRRQGQRRCCRRACLRRHAGAGDPPSAPPLDISKLEEQLRNITARIETLRPTNDLEESHHELPQRSRRIGRQLTEALPRHAVESLQIEVQALAQRIDHSREAGASIPGRSPGSNAASPKCATRCTA